MFLGTYEPRLDDKGRLILPAKFRDRLDGGLVITRGQEHCLYVFSRDAFSKVLEKLQQAPLTSKQARSYTRVFLSGANDQVPDRQGRITIPAILRGYADLERDLVVIGSGDRVEIWDRKAWNDYLADNEAQFADLEDEIIPGVL
ncbi:division/cell wall cluster transcriptional repressor MraZ [Arcanobacterium sp. S3PF19]|uniref:division/cell wall cluster transcriptional repressor MraZ n=1 Tax=Arcanobacterium sp. S3PF19 TaxID=1219585 RepID=UPI00050EF8C2|nr:division/cell wall cluster transcriptional repressor MraZ [Arcanobacterium sp. S3PF19]KGF05453.1 cell division protein MraZ [Arcanobacterium sp. S3PF19]